MATTSAMAVNTVACSLPSSTGTSSNFAVAFSGIYNLMTTTNAAMPMDALINNSAATISSINTTTAT